MNKEDKKQKKEKFADELVKTMVGELNKKALEEIGNERDPIVNAMMDELVANLNRVTRDS